MWKYQRNNFSLDSMILSQTGSKTLLPPWSALRHLFRGWFWVQWRGFLLDLDLDHQPIHRQPLTALELTEAGIWWKITSECLDVPISDNLMCFAFTSNYETKMPPIPTPIPTPTPTHTTFILFERICIWLSVSQSFSLQLKSFCLQRLATEAPWIPKQTEDNKCKMLQIGSAGALEPLFRFNLKIHFDISGFHPWLSWFISNKNESI